MGILDLSDLLRPATPASPDLRISVIVLAAGMSRRMGEDAKQLLDVGGMPMVRRTVLNVLDFGPVETIVVTGHRAEDVEAALAGLPVTVVRNAAHRQGQPTSVVAGARALTAYCNAVMVVLADQPLINAERLREVAAAYHDLGDASILVPHHKGVRGNPVVFAARHVPAVIGGGLNVGCRHLIEDHAEEVARVEFDSDAFTVDCDTPDDYRRLVERITGASPQ